VQQQIGRLHLSIKGLTELDSNLGLWLSVWRLAQVLLVNLVTSTTLGLALAAEPAEPTVMDQPPRRPNKRLVGKLLLWRMFFVCHVVVCLVLGMFAWAQAGGYSLGQSRAEAFNILVGSQVRGQSAALLC
jgi:magnesium-transporting ATPase (P-type)